jgi:hypothetical protein
VRLRRLAAAVAVLALAASCASTTSKDRDRSDPLASGSDAGASAGPDATAEPGAATTSGGGTPNGAGSSSGAATTGRATRGAGASAPSAVTDRTPVRMGFIVIDLGGAEKVLAGFGTQVSFGDGELEAKALVADLNERGGIRGRKVLGFYARVNPASADPAAAYIAGCTKLTEDHKVDVVITVLNVTQGFVDCVANHRTLVINESFNPGDDHLLKQHKDWLFSPSLMSLDRGTELLLRQLKEAGGLGKGTKVGVVVNGNDPQLPRVSNRVVKRLLSAWKVPFVEQVVRGTNSTDIAGAVLRFRSDMVNRVVFVAPNGLIQLQFMTFAEDQGYRPKYSFWDPDSPKFVSESVPDEQARNISGFGALPVSDVPPSQYPTTPGEKRCLAIFTKAGEPSQNRNSNLASTLYCEAVWAYEAAAVKITGRITAPLWRAAYRALGRSYRPLSTFGVDFGNGRNDNADLYRTLAWSDRCSCVKFTSGNKKAPRP